MTDMQHRPRGEEPVMPLHPLERCRRGGLCDFRWRIEKLDGALVQQPASRMPKDDERLAERCIRCRGEAG